MTLFRTLVFTFLFPFINIAPLLAAGDWRDEIIYFVIVDRFADGRADNNQHVDITHKGSYHGGDLAGLRKHLDEIAELGVTALWITPVVKQIDHYVEGAGFPDWAYHGYWADDFNRMEPHFGTEDELRALVEACHARGIKVLLDVVYNHAGYDSAYTKAANANDWLRTGRRQSPCGSDDLTQCLSGLPDFKTELPEVADYLLKAHLGLAKRVGLDGFRLDTVKHVAHPFWAEHRARTRAELGPNFFLLGEVWGGDAEVLDPYFAGDELDAGFDFGFRGSAMAFIQGRGRTVAFSRYLQKRHQVRQGHYLSQYLSSHDEPGALFQLSGNKTLFRLCAALQLTSSGIPTIFYGEEVAREIGAWPENRTDMPWGERAIAPGAGKRRDEEMRAYYRQLIATRKAHLALSRGDYQALVTDGDQLVFARAYEGDLVWVAVNRAEQAATLNLPRPAGWVGKALRDELGGAPPTGEGETLTLTLAPRSAAIFAAAP